MIFTKLNWIMKKFKIELNYCKNNDVQWIYKLSFEYLSIFFISDFITGND